MPAVPNGLMFFAMQVRLWQLGKLLPDRLAAHLESHAVLPVLYASAWFMTCFASDFPISFAARVLDVVMTDCYASPMMKVCGGTPARKGSAGSGGLRGQPVWACERVCGEESHLV